MPVRVSPEQTEQEAREQTQQLRQRPVTPPAPLPPGPFARPETRQRKLGAITQRMREQPVPEQFEPWTPLDDLSDIDRDKAQANPQFRNFIDRRAGQEFVDFTEWWTSLYDQASGLPPSPIESKLPLSPTSGGRIVRPEIGQPEEVVDAYWAIYQTRKNLLKYRQFLERTQPEQVKKLIGSRQGATVSPRTLDPLISMMDALDDIHDERPDNYSQYISSDEGYADLLVRSLANMVSAPKREITFLPVPPLGQTATPGEAVSTIIEHKVPELPLHGKEILQNYVEFVGDPLIWVTLPIFSGPTLAAKAGLMGKMAVGSAIGEEVAEEVGQPGIIGSLAGMAVAPAALGFTRAALRNGLARARHNPKFMEPATRALIDSGELGFGVDSRLLYEAPEEALQTGRQRFYRGISSARAGAPIEEGAFLTPNVEDALVYARTDAKIPQWKGSPVVQMVEVEPGATAPHAEGLAGARGAVTVTNSAGVFLEGTAPARTVYDAILRQMGVAPVAGGALRGVGPDLDYMEQTIYALTERPEAQDILRKVANVLADHIPGARRLVEIQNRAALNDPWIKGSFGWQVLKSGDDSARFLDMAKLRARGRPPFPQNAKGQFWLPDNVNKPSNFLLRRGGSWTAIGDVMEGIERLDPAIMARVTPEQTAWALEAIGRIRPYVEHAERITGLKIAKRQTWWPRFVIDPTKPWRFGVSAGAGKPPALFQRSFEVQQEAIDQYGIRYKPDFFNQMDLGIQGMQRITRDTILGQYLKKVGILKYKGPTLEYEYASRFFPAGGRGTVIPVIHKDVMREVMEIIGPSHAGTTTRTANAISAIFRATLTGTVDHGVGAIQLLTLAASPAGPEGWARAMGRSIWHGLTGPRGLYDFIANNPAAREYAMYGGNVGFENEFLEGLQYLRPFMTPYVTVPVGAGIGAGVAKGLGQPPELGAAIGGGIGLGMRPFVNRIQLGFDSALLLGRVYAFDAMASAAKRPGLLTRLAGAPKALEGEALHNELFRVARFADTLTGQPRLGGIVSASQLQAESAWVWFSPRYLRSMLGTLSYMVGKGYTPAVARVTMAKLLLGGMATMSGVIAGVGYLRGDSQEQILDNITTALNPQTGKKFMSMKVGDTWFGLGGIYRAGIAFVGGLADKENWQFEEWEEPLWDNPIVRWLRSRTSPVTGTLMDYIEGEDFRGQPVARDYWVDDPRKLLDYLSDKFSPITIGAFLQQHGDWQQRTPAAIAEFFGLRTSPETAEESIRPVMDRVSQYTFGAPFEELEYNVVAQDFVRNHPDVVAVTEGRVRPIRESTNQKNWRLYREGRDDIREEFMKQKERLDEALASGRMDGRTYMDEYRMVQAREFERLQGMRETLSKAVGLSLEEDEEAPAGTVDYALGKYFDINIEDYRDPKSLEVDWDMYFADRDAALASIPKAFVPMVEEWLRRHETPIRRSFRTKFEETIKPSGYFRTRETVAIELGLNLNDLEAGVIKNLKEKEARAAPTDVGRMIDQFLDDILEEVYGDPTTREREAPRLNDLREMMRERSPELDLELFRQGFTTTVRSEAAVELARRYMRTYPDMGYFIPALAADVRRELERQRQ